MIDLLVAGGGPAGLVTALHAARAGLDVVVVEPRPGPIDKACGEGLMPAALRALAELGVDPAGHPIRGIRYLDAADPERGVAASFRSGPGRGVRRTELHAALLGAAQAAGIGFVTAAAGPVEQDALSVRAAGLRARYLAAADGLHSPIRRGLGLDAPSRGARRWGIRRHFELAPWTDQVEVYWSPRSEAYVTPVGERCVGVAVLTRDQQHFDAHLGEFPALARRVADAEPGPVRAAGPLRQRARRLVEGRVLLVGDAAGYVDALTGEGLAIAFAAAEALARSVALDHPQAYPAAWRRLSRRYRLLTTALLGAASYPPARRQILPVATALPRVFAATVNQLAQ